MRRTWRVIPADSPRYSWCSVWPSVSSSLAGCCLPASSSTRRSIEMSAISQGLRIQGRVIGALMMRELLTRYGRHNIGFLWIMVEPLLFAVLVGVLWNFMWGATKHGIGVMSFVVSG